MDYENELQVLEILRDAFCEVYRATKILGQEHPEYKILNELDLSINKTICTFHKYRTGRTKRRLITIDVVTSPKHYKGVILK